MVITNSKVPYYSDIVAVCRFIVQQRQYYYIRPEPRSQRGEPINYTISTKAKTGFQMLDTLTARIILAYYEQIKDPDRKHRFLGAHISRILAVIC